MTLRHVWHWTSWALLYAIFVTIAWIIQRLPLGASRAFAAALAWLVFLVPTERRLILANLRLVFPEWDDARRGAVGRRSLRNLILGYLEFLWTWGRPDRLTALVDCPAAERERYAELKRRHGGVIFLTPHCGNWELGLLAGNLHGIPAAAVARRQPNPWLDRAMAGGRQQLGAGLIYEKGAARQIHQTLAAGGNIAMLVDQNTRPHQGGTFVPFCGLPATMSRAPAVFARRAHAGLVFALCLRDEHDRLRLAFTPLPEIAGPGDLPDEAALCAAIARATEVIVRAHPEQYLWLYRRWRYLPPDWSPTPPPGAATPASGQTARAAAEAAPAAAGAASPPTQAATIAPPYYAKIYHDPRPAHAR